MSAKFRERVSRTMALINKMDEYEKNHPDEWCPISDQLLKEMYPDECSSQEGRDAKAESMSNEEFEVVFDATMLQYRKVRKKKKQTSQEEGQESDQQVVEAVIEER
jgi:hypothetical protein